MSNACCHLTSTSLGEMKSPVQVFVSSFLGDVFNCILKLSRCPLTTSTAIFCVYTYLFPSWQWPPLQYYCIYSIHAFSHDKLCLCLGYTFFGTILFSMGTLMNIQGEFGTLISFLAKLKRFGIKISG